jgi:hypothetical protein
MRSGLCLAVSCFLIVAALAQSPPGHLSAGDFDLACAVVAGAEMGASQSEQNIPRRDMALTIFAFYLGRLTWTGRQQKIGTRLPGVAWRSCSKTRVLQKC